MPRACRRPGQSRGVLCIPTAGTDCQWGQSEDPRGRLEPSLLHFHHEVINGPRDSLLSCDVAFGALPLLGK